MELFLFFGNILQCSKQIIPEFFYRSNIHFFVRRMRVTNGWAKGNHIHIGIMHADNATFQSGMNNFNIGESRLGFQPG